jgi:hypothetical protein
MYFCIIFGKYFLCTKNLDNLQKFPTLMNFYFKIFNAIYVFLCKMDSSPFIISLQKVS